VVDKRGTSSLPRTLGTAVLACFLGALIAGLVTLAGDGLTSGIGGSPPMPREWAGNPVAMGALGGGLIFIFPVALWLAGRGGRSLSGHIGVTLLILPGFLGGSAAGATAGGMGWALGVLVARLANQQPGFFTSGHFRLWLGSTLVATTLLLVRWRASGGRIAHGSPSSKDGFQAKPGEESAP
jgi:hypothetical protein